MVVITPPDWTRPSERQKYRLAPPFWASLLAFFDETAGPAAVLPSRRIKVLTLATDPVRRDRCAQTS